MKPEIERAHPENLEIKSPCKKKVLEKAKNQIWRQSREQAFQK